METAKKTDQRQPNYTGQYVLNLLYETFRHDFPASTRTDATYGMAVAEALAIKGFLANLEPYASALSASVGTLETAIREVGLSDFLDYPQLYTPRKLKKYLKGTKGLPGHEKFSRKSMEEISAQARKLKETTAIRIRPVITELLLGEERMEQVHKFTTPRWETLYAYLQKTAPSDAIISDPHPRLLRLLEKEWVEEEMADFGRFLERAEEYARGCLADRVRDLPVTNDYDQVFTLAEEAVAQSHEALLPLPEREKRRVWIHGTPTMNLDYLTISGIAREYYETHRLEGLPEPLELRFTGI